MSFKFVNTLGKKLSKHRYINSVIFPLTKYGKYDGLLVFSNKFGIELITENEVIKKVEKYLSEPISEHYYANFKDEVDHHPNFRDLKKNGFTNRGSLLFDMIHIDKIVKINSGCVKVVLKI